MKRRDFLKTSVLGSAVPWDSLTQTAVASAPPWYDRPMRWAQIAFVEDDPGNYNQEFWLDYLQRLHVDAVCLSAGGMRCVLPHVDPHALPQ